MMNQHKVGILDIFMNNILNSDLLVFYLYQSYIFGFQLESILNSILKPPVHLKICSMLMYSKSFSKTGLHVRNYRNFYVILYFTGVSSRGGDHVLCPFFSVRYPIFSKRTKIRTDKNGHKQTKTVTEITCFLLLLSPPTHPHPPLSQSASSSLFLLLLLLLSFSSSSSSSVFLLILLLILLFLSPPPPPSPPWSSSSSQVLLLLLLNLLFLLLLLILLSPSLHSPPQPPPPPPQSFSSSVLLISPPSFLLPILILLLLLQNGQKRT